MLIIKSMHLIDLHFRTCLVSSGWGRGGGRWGKRVLSKTKKFKEMYEA